MRQNIDKKCVLILSGGVDSTTLLYEVVKGGYQVYAIGFGYGQRHIKELDYAAKTCYKLGVPYIIADIPQILGGSALTDKLIEVPEGHYAADNMKITVVPNRNAIMIMLAAGYAESIGASKVFYGVHAGDHFQYWDTRPEFFKAINDVLVLNDLYPVKLKAPFINMTKIDIVKLGIKLSVDYSQTWSCYLGEERPCLKCGTDIERTESFLKNNIKDPLLTNEEWKRAVGYYEEVMGGKLGQ